MSAEENDIFLKIASTTRGYNGCQTTTTTTIRNQRRQSPLGN